MKRFFVVFTLAAVAAMSLSLIACKNNETTKATTRATTAQQATTTEAQKVTTEAPTTEAPTTKAPTTEAPTTEAPTTVAPVTDAPTTTEEVTTTEHVHEFGDWTVTTEATCTQEGVKTRTCGCGETETEAIPMADHTYVKTEAVEPTWDTAGNVEYYTCSVCQKIFVIDSTATTVAYKETTSDAVVVPMKELNYGTADTPIDAATAAKEAAKMAVGDTNSNTAYVKGYVVSGGPKSGTYNCYIADAADGSATIYAAMLKSENTIYVGSYVEVCGNYYNDEKYAGALSGATVLKYTNPDIDAVKYGTADAPISVAEGLENGRFFIQTSSDYAYVMGYVLKSESKNLYIYDGTDDTKTIDVYNSKFTAGQFAVGTPVVVKGKYQNYFGKIELTNPTVTTVQYTVTFDTNGGSAIDAVKVDYGTSAAALASITTTKTGYTFAGWMLPDGSAVTADMTVTQDITVKASWTAIEYTITYVLNGGTNSESNVATYTIETESIKLLDATLFRNTFAGWYEKETFDADSQIVEIAKGSTGNKTFYAKFVDASLVKDGTKTETEPTDGNVLHIETEKVKKATYDGLYTLATRTAYYYYNETVDGNFESRFVTTGTDTHSTTRTYAQMNVTKISFEYLIKNACTTNVADKEANYIVQILGSDGSYDVLDFAPSSTDGTTWGTYEYTLTNDQMLKFCGFIVKCGGLEGEILIANIKTTVTPFTIAFNTNGGTEVASQTVNSITKFGALTIANPTKDNCVFAGWTLETAELTADTAISSDMTVIAKWYEIIATNPVSKTASSTITTDVKTNLTNVIAGGWVATGTPLSSVDLMPYSMVKFYARGNEDTTKWLEIKDTATFAVDCGAFSGTTWHEIKLVKEDSSFRVYVDGTWKALTVTNLNEISVQLGDGGTFYFSELIGEADPTYVSPWVTISSNPFAVGGTASTDIATGYATSTALTTTWGTYKFGSVNLAPYKTIKFSVKSEGYYGVMANGSVIGETDGGKVWMEIKMVKNADGTWQLYYGTEDKGALTLTNGNLTDLDFRFGTETYYVSELMGEKDSSYVDPYTTLFTNPFTVEGTAGTDTPAGYSSCTVLTTSWGTYSFQSADISAYKSVQFCVKSSGWYGVIYGDSVKDETDGSGAWLEIKLVKNTDGTWELYYGSKDEGALTLANNNLTDLTFRFGTSTYYVTEIIAEKA